MENFTQLCVWPGTLISSDRFSEPTEKEIKKFEKFMKDNFQVTVKYEASIQTAPDLDKEGKPIYGTGGRNDVFFYIDNDDIPRFAIERLQYGISWWEDMGKYNNHENLYPADFVESHPYTW